MNREYHLYIYLCDFTYSLYKVEHSMSDNIKVGFKVIYSFIDKSFGEDHRRCIYFDSSKNKTYITCIFPGCEFAGVDRSDKTNLNGLIDLGSMSTIIIEDDYPAYCDSCCECVGCLKYIPKDYSELSVQQICYDINKKDKSVYDDDEVSDYEYEDSLNMEYDDSIDSPMSGPAFE